MDHTLLRTWLALPPGPWPPDHYALLGLTPGPIEPAAVEPRVLEHMDRLRRHQLVHPELVTEGMNRLAQALITLTDPAEKAAYDTALGVAPPAPSAVAAASPVVQAEAAPPTYDVLPPDEAIPAREPEPLSLDWETVGQPPPPGDTGEAVPPVRLGPPPAAPVVAFPGGRRWLYTRLALLRKARRAWDRLGPILGDPQDPVDRPGRVLLLLEAAGGVRPLLPALRGMVGEVGQPGGIVAAVVTQPLLLDTFRRLLADQRQALAIDWRRGQTALLLEAARLRRTARESRSRPAGTRRAAARALGWVKETPELVLAALAGLALGVALLRGTTGR